MSKDLIQLHFAVILFGLVGLFGKLLSLPPTTIVLGRTCIAACVLALALGKRLNLRSTLKLIPSGLLLAFHWFAFFESIRLSSVAVGLLTIATFPMFVVFIEPLFTRRKIKRTDIVSSVLVFCGVLLIVPSFDIGDAVFQGVLWGLVSSFTFALLTLFNQRFVIQFNALQIGFAQCFWAAICLLPFYQPLLVVSAREWGLLLILGVFCTALAHILYITALKTLRAQFVSIATALEPVYGIVLAAGVLGEVPTVREICGGLVIIGVVARNSRIDHVHIHDQV